MVSDSICDVVVARGAGQAPYIFGCFLENWQNIFLSENCRQIILSKNVQKIYG